MNKKDKQRVDLDVSPVGPWKRNYDYGDDSQHANRFYEPGLYFGKMDRYKSVKDFLAQRRAKRKRRKKALRQFALELIKTH